MGTIFASREEWRELVQYYELCSAGEKKAIDNTFFSLDQFDKWVGYREEYSGHYILVYRLKKFGKLLSCLIPKERAKHTWVDYLRNKRITVTYIMDMTEYKQIKGMSKETASLTFLRYKNEEVIDYIMQIEKDELEVINSW